MSIPAEACVHATTSQNEIPNPPNSYATDITHTWTCPFVSVANSTTTAGTADWRASTVTNTFLDYNFATSTQNNRVTVGACERSYTGVTTVCAGATGLNTAGPQETLGPGFSKLQPLGATGSWWDYYYVVVTSRPTGNWTTGDRTLNNPTFVGLGFN